MSFVTANGSIYDVDLNYVFSRINYFLTQRWGYVMTINDVLIENDCKNIEFDELHNIVAKLDGYSGAERDKLIERAAQLIFPHISQKSTIAEYYFYAGEICVKQKNNLQAYDYYQQAISLNESYFDAWFGVGRVRFLQEDFYGAVQHLERANSLQPNNIECLLCLSHSYFGSHRLEDAMDVLYRILDIQPDCDHAYYLMGIQHQALGEYTKAKEAFEKVFMLKPDRIEVYYQLVLMREFSGQEDEIIERLETLLKTKQLVQNQDILALFSIAILQDRQKKYDKAFAYYKKANDLINMRGQIDIREYEDLVSNSMHGFTKDIFEHYRSAVNPSRKPIFVLGVMRSGTTLVERILGRHPDVYAAGEISKMYKITAELLHKNTDHKQYPRDISHIKSEDFKQFGEDYLEYIDGISGGATKHVTDKLPLNVFHIGLIALLFPNAKIIHCVRDPIDTCLSCYFQCFSNRINSVISSDLERLAKYYKLKQKMMDHWKKCFPDMIMDVHYEDLIEQPDIITRDMLAHLKLNWDDVCLDQSHNSGAVFTASQYQVRQPIYKSSIKRWKNYEAHLQPLIQAFAGS